MLERVIKLAAASATTPIAFVALRDEQQRAMQCAVGLGEAPQPLDHAPIIAALENAGADDIIIASNGVIASAPHLRFCAIAPLRPHADANDQTCIGALCIADTQARAGLSDDETNTLLDLAALATETLAADAEARTRDLALAELKHRVGNVLTQVTGLIMLGDSKDLTKQDYIAELRRRVSSLHEANRRLADVDWSETDLGVVLTDALRPVLGNRADAVITSGPALNINARAAMSLALIVSELAANSVKHGALKNCTEGLSCTWRVDGDSFELSWRESFANAASAPKKEHGPSGFGSTLLNKLGPSELSGTATHEVTPSSVAYTLKAPLKSLR